MSKVTIAIITGAIVGSFGFGFSIGQSTASASKKLQPGPGSPAPPQPSVPASAAAPPAGSVPVNPAGIFTYGFPGPISDRATHPGHISAYDRRQRNPAWTAEHMTASSLAQRVGDRRNSNFAEDTTIPTLFRARLQDYFRSGYDRGHQVPAADCKWSQAAMDATFLLSNICPQVGDGFNRDYWAHFEDWCRRLTKQWQSVRVVTGPLYLPTLEPGSAAAATGGKWVVKHEVIGNPPTVAVPTHFFKVIFGEDSQVVQSGGKKGMVALGAFVLPNAAIPNSTPLESFEVPLEVVERASGLEFASNLPKERRKRLCAETSCNILVREFARNRNSPSDKSKL